MAGFDWRWEGPEMAPQAPHKRRYPLTATAAYPFRNSGITRSAKRRRLFIAFSWP